MSGKRRRIVQGYTSTDWECTNKKCGHLNVVDYGDFVGETKCNKCEKFHYVSRHHDGSVRFHTDLW